MKIVFGLKDDEIEAFCDVYSTIHLLYDDNDFPDDMSDEQFERYVRWREMCDCLDKIYYVIENQIEIECAEKTATGMSPVAACENCSMLSGQLSEKEIRCVRKMIKELNFDCQ